MHAKHSQICTHRQNWDTHTLLEAPFILISLWDYWRQMGEQWESGLPSLQEQRHAGINTHILYRKDHRLGQKVAHIQTDGLKCSRKRLTHTISHTHATRWLSHSHTHTYLLVNTVSELNTASSSSNTHTHTGRNMHSFIYSHTSREQLAFI